MNKTLHPGRRLCFGIWLALVFSGWAQLVSPANPVQAPASGGGDSVAPIISQDGRYVLFASTANNLCLTTNHTSIPARWPAPLNVFLRDRSNATTVLVSVDLSGVAGGNGDSLPVELSTNGQYALFESAASDLVPGDTNNATDVFVRDLVKGTTVLVSGATNGLPGNGVSRSAAMTPDGRYVAFVSAANNLVPGDTNRIPDVFVRDLEAGTNILASVGANAIGTLRGSSEAPEITPDGRFVAFCSTATNLVAGITGTMDVYVRDLVARTTVWASTGARAALQAAFHLPGAASFNHAVSADGGVVAYEATPSVSGPGLYPGGGLVLRYHVDSGATDVVYTNAYVPAGAYELTRSLAMTPDGRFIAFVANTNGNSGATTCIRLWDALAFASAPKLVSGGTNNLVATNTTASWPALDASGRYVAFLSNGTNFVTNSLVGAYHLYLRDMQADTTQLFDADDNGIGSPLSPAAGPSLSADDRVVAFECIEANLAPNDRNHDCDVFARDLHAGTTELISVHDPALASVTANGAASVAAESVSFDGRLVAYASEADNLTPNLLGGRNIFVRDLVAGTNVLVSVATNGASGDGTSSEPAISPDGRYVGFTSRADNLVAADTNQAQDVFVRDLVAGTTVLVSVNMNGTGPGNADSYSPRISSGGRYVLFQSRANNLAPGSGGLSDSLFLRDLRGRVTYRLTGSGAPANKLAAMTPDGHFVLYVDAVSLYAFYVAVWDSQLGGRIYSNSLTTTPFTVPFTGLAISAGGQRLAFCFNSGSGRALTTVDLGTGGATVVESSATSYHQGLQLSADGRFLAAIRSTTTLNTNQIYLYDLQTGTNVLVSQSGVSGGPANGASDSPGLSPDGRLVAYRSAASDLVTGDGNGVPDVFVYDTQTVTTTLLSAGGNRSLRPVFSGDGRTLVFESWAADLAAQDFNHASDIFAYALQSVGPTPLFRAMVLPGAPGQALWITWPTVAGKSYRAQFKDNLTDATWQDLPSQIRLLGSQGYLADPGAGSGQRFYRIVEF